jgi:HPt (histidine-containing phosphotransfer) domain-containing protein
MLLDLFDGDRAAVAGLLAAGRDSMEDDLRRIERAAQQRDAHALSEAAHSLKGASASIGCTRVSELSASIERAAVANSAGLDPAMLGQLRLAMDALATDIRSFSAEAAP